MKKKALKHWREYYYEMYIDTRRECEDLKQRLLELETNNEYLEGKTKFQEGRIKELESEVEALRAVGKGYWTYRKKDAWTPPPAPGAEQKPPSTS